MRPLDLITLASGALREHRLRSGLSMLGIGIGVTAVLLVTAMGEGARRYVVEQFQQFGTNVLQINPGKTETFGLPGAVGGTTHKLTIEDALALQRLRGVESVVPVAMGQARVEHGALGRSVYVLGVTSDAPALWRFGIRRGTFLPAGDARRGSAEVVLGAKLARELFGEAVAVGSHVRVAGARLRVIGVTEPKGQILGFDMDDIAYVPTATALRLFDLEELVEIDVTFAREDLLPGVVSGVTSILRERHGGREDFTVLSNADMLGVFDRVMEAVTLAVVAIAMISLVVGAIGILTTMWIAVGERTYEIGLLRALGATAKEIGRIFLVESVVLSTCGGLGGLAVALGLVGLLRLAVPGMPLGLPPAAIAAALGVSVAAGLFSGVAPARRAARLDPVEALRAE